MAILMSIPLNGVSMFLLAFISNLFNVFLIEVMKFPCGFDVHFLGI